MLNRMDVLGHIGVECKAFRKKFNENPTKLYIGIEEYEAIRLMYKDVYNSPTSLDNEAMLGMDVIEVKETNYIGVS